MSMTKRPAIKLSRYVHDLPDDEYIWRARDIILETLLDTQLGADILGELVRLAWVAWAREQPTPKPGWLTPWGELNEADQEADRRIGLAVARYMIETLIRVSYPALRPKGHTHDKFR